MVIRGREEKKLGAIAIGERRGRGKIIVDSQR